MTLTLTLNLNEPICMKENPNFKILTQVGEGGIDQKNVGLTMCDLYKV